MGRQWPTDPEHPDLDSSPWAPAHMHPISSYQARRILAARQPEPCRHPRCRCSIASRAPAQAVLAQRHPQPVKRGGARLESRLMKTHQSTLPHPAVYNRSMEWAARSRKRLGCRRKLGLEHRLPRLPTLNTNASPVLVHRDPLIFQQALGHLILGVSSA